MNIFLNAGNVKKAKYVRGGDVILHNQHCYICTRDSTESGSLEFIDIPSGEKVYFDKEVYVEVFPDATLFLNEPNILK